MDQSVRDFDPFDQNSMAANVDEASRFLKTLAHPTRLLILCHLIDGEYSVGELETILDMRQPALSQQLARLRSDDLVKTRRESKNVYYSLNSGAAETLIGTLHEIFCQDTAART